MKVLWICLLTPIHRQNFAKKTAADSCIKLLLESVPQETALGPDITVVNLFFNLLSLVWSTYIKFDSQFDLQPPAVISKTKVQWV